MGTSRGGRGRFAARGRIGVGRRLASGASSVKGRATRLYDEALVGVDGNDLKMRGIPFFWELEVAGHPICGCVGAGRLSG